MKWYQPETDCYLKANRVDHGREYQDAIAEVIASRVGELLHILVRAISAMPHSHK